MQMPLSRNRLYVAGIGRLAPDRSLRRGRTAARFDLGAAPCSAIAVERWFRIEGYHSFTRQDTRLAGGQITRNVAGVQFVVAEPVRIR